MTASARTSTTSPDRPVPDRRRWSPWITLPLYLLAAAVLAVDIWGVVFWARVGGRLGTVTAVVGVVVALGLATAVVLGLRGRWSARGSRTPSP
jgi:hypothetical protein